MTNERKQRKKLLRKTVIEKQTRAKQLNTIKEIYSSLVITAIHWLRTPLANKIFMLWLVKGCQCTRLRLIFHLIIPEIASLPRYFCHRLPCVGCHLHSASWRPSEQGRIALMPLRVECKTAKS